MCVQSMLCKIQPELDYFNPPYPNPHKSRLTAVMHLSSQCCKWLALADQKQYAVFYRIPSRGYRKVDWQPATVVESVLSGNLNRSVWGCPLGCPSVEFLVGSKGNNKSFTWSWLRLDEMRWDWYFHVGNETRNFTITWSTNEALSWILTLWIFKRFFKAE